MTYQVLSLKWRPQNFEDVIGQEHISITLSNMFVAVDNNFVFMSPIPFFCCFLIILYTSVAVRPPPYMKYFALLLFILSDVV